MRSQITLYAIIAILMLVAVIVLWRPISEEPIPAFPMQTESVTTLIQSCLDQAISSRVEEFGWEGSYRLGADVLILGADPATAEHVVIWDHKKSQFPTFIAWQDDLALSIEDSVLDCANDELDNTTMVHKEFPLITMTNAGSKTTIHLYWPLTIKTESTTVDLTNWESSLDLQLLPVFTDTKNILAMITELKEIDLDIATSTQGDLTIRGTKGGYLFELAYPWLEDTFFYRFGVVP